MTPLDLLDVLEEFVRRETKDMLLPVRVDRRSGEPKERPAEIYKMRLPTKKAQTERVPYLLLQYIKSTDTQEPGQEPESVCTVRIVAATYSEDESEGATCVLNLLTRIRVALLKDGVIGERYMLKPPLEMIVYPDGTTAPYYLGEMMTEWESMKSFREVVDNLRSSLGGLSETEQVAAATAIFGKESFAGMLAIVNASEADFQKLSDSVNNSAGAAERMAQIKLDNFQGKVTLLQSAVEGLQIALGDALLPTFTEGAEKAAELISKLTEFINANPELVRTITKVVTGLLAFKAAGLVAKLAFLDLKGGVLTIQKVMALFKGKFALAGVEAVGFASKVKGVAKSVTGYFGGIGSAAGGVGRAFGQMFAGTKIGNLFSGIGGAVGGVFTRIFSGVGGVATRAFTGVAGTITGILGRAGAAVAAGPLGKIGSVVAKGFGKLSTLFGPLQKLGGAILGPFSGILGKVLPVVGVITLIISAVQILRDNLDKVREVIRNVFGDAGVEVFDKIVSAISNIGSTIQSIFTDGNLGGARDFLINLFGEEATGVTARTTATTSRRRARP